MPKENVVKVDRAYLETFQRQIDAIRNELFTNVMGASKSTNPNTTGTIPIVDGNLKVSGGAPNFQALTTLNAQLAKMGGSARTQLEWLDKVLVQMSSNIKTTIDNFGKAEELSLEDAVALANNVPDYPGVTPVSAPTPSA